MKRPLISVIIPCLNVEKSIELSINSVLNQTIVEDIEIIVVDGGSTDNTLKIIKNKFSKKVTLLRSRFKGIPCQVYVGVNASKGDYIGFIDADDYIDPRMYEILLRNLRESNSEVSCCKVKNGNIMNYSFLNEYNQKIDTHIIDPYVQCRASRCNKLILKSCALEVLKFYNETLNVNIWEDTIFSFALYSITKKIVETNLQLYTYCLTPYSSSRTIKNNLEQLKKITILCDKYNDIYNKWHNPLYYRLLINPFQSIYLICLQTRKDKLFYFRRRKIYKIIYESSVFKLIYNKCPFDKTTECIAGRKDVTINDYNKFIKTLNKMQFLKLDMILLFHGFKKILYKLLSLKKF